MINFIIKLFKKVDTEYLLYDSVNDIFIIAVTPPNSTLPSYYVYESGVQPSLNRNGRYESLGRL